MIEVKKCSTLSPAGFNSIPLSTAEIKRSWLVEARLFSPLHHSLTSPLFLMGKVTLTFLEGCLLLNNHNFL